MSFDEGSQYRIDASLVAAALRLEPIQYVGIQTDGDGGLRPRAGYDHARLAPEVLVDLDLRCIGRRRLVVAAPSF